MQADLHTHSTASDGTFTPTELMQEASRIGLRAIALTDHDTTAGLDEAALAASSLGLEFIRGCELSAQYEREELHVVGLWLPQNPDKLQAALREIVEHRHSRNYIIIEKLQQCGVDITYESVQAIAGEGSVGRPHIALRLVELGRAASVQDAFNRYLGAKGKAYTPKKVLSPAEAVKVLKEEGATVILAHPGLLSAGWAELERLLRELQEYGLDGVESHYSEHSPSMRAGVERLADKLGLAVSGGSDFHGSVKPQIQLGKGKGNVCVPYSVIERLKELRQSQGLPV